MLKNYIKLNFPSAITSYKKLKNKVRVKIFNKNNEVVFENIYKTNFWKDEESISGPGSTINNTKNFNQQLVKLLEDYKIKIFVDAPCGDFNWMKELNLPVEKYIGIDIVEDLINNNKKNFEKENKIFIKQDITKDEFPNSDMILCRDCFVHLSNDRILKALKNMKRGKSKYLLTTTYIDTWENKDIVTGEWRKVNMEFPPFNLSKPVELIFEDCESGDENGNQSRDKYLGLWEINKINI